MAQPWRLPEVNADDGAWGDILNQFLNKEHNNVDAGGAGNAASGGHMNVTLLAGTTLLAPLTFTSSTNQLATMVAGAVEFYNNRFYMTQIINSVTNRRAVALLDDSAGAAGDMYYRDQYGNLVTMHIGSQNNILTVNGSNVPAWSVPTTLTQPQVMAITSMRM
jgi:hypothetical protein